MLDARELLDRGIPDLVPTGDLPPVLGAEIDYLAGRTDAWTSERPEVHRGVRARALVVAGQHEAARHVLSAAGSGPWTPQGLAAATWAASRVGPPEVVAALASEVGGLAPGFLFEGDVPLGPSALLVGLVAAARGDLAEAADRLATATSQGDRRAPVWGALARLELGRVLWSMADDGTGDPDTPVAARRALASAQTFFAAGGYRHLGRLAGELAGSPRPTDAAVPGLGHLVAGRAWIAGFGVQPPVVLRAGKGLVALRHLVTHRDRQVPAVELDRLLSGQMDDPWQGIDLDLLRSEHDLDGADLSQRLRSYLMDDRARSRVSKLVRRTIATLSGVHGLLGRHLASCIRTGYSCRYDADSRIVWRL